MILHIDMDAFFASIEQAINPAYRNRPLIVGSRGKKLNTVVCAASYEAKRLGITSGMSTKEAFLICPEAEFIEADSAKYVYISEAIFDMLFDYDPNPQYVSIDEFRLDLRKLVPEKYEGLTQEIKARIFDEFGITCSIGIAVNCLLAKLASKLNKPNGVCILDDLSLNKILKNTPVEKLCGVGVSTKTRLNELGIFTCLELYNLTQEFLNSYFGKSGFNLFLSLHSKDCLKINPIVSKPKSVGHSYTLERPISDQKLIFDWLRMLSEMVSTRLRKQDLKARKVGFWVVFEGNFNGFSRQKTYQNSTNDGLEIYAKIARIWLNSGLKNPLVRALGVSTGLLEPDNGALLEEVKKREALLKIMDKINQKFGDWSLFPAQISQIKQ